MRLGVVFFRESPFSAGLQSVKNGLHHHQQWSQSVHEFYCIVLGIVATVVSLIDNLGGAVNKMSTKRNSNHYESIVVSQ